jgi:hypothetical protein
MAYDIQKVRAQGADDESIARYLSQQYGYDIDGVMQQGASYTDVADYLAKTDPHEVAMRHFRGQGWSPEQAAGITGNLSYESDGMKPVVTEYGKGGGGGFGLAQWTGTRRKALFQYAASKGEQEPSFKTQLEFVDQELNSSEHGAVEALRNAKTVPEATRLFMQTFERPGIPNVEGRYARAAKAFKAGGVESPVQEQVRPKGEAPAMVDDFGRVIGQEQALSPGEISDNLLDSMTPEGVERMRGPARAAGMITGGILATPGDVVGGPVPTIAGAAGGAVTADQLMNWIKQKIIAHATGKTVEPTLKEALIGPNPLGEEGNYGAAGAGVEGASWEVGGQAAGKVLGGAASLVGKGGRQVLGKLTGAGEESMAEAVRSGENLKGVNVFKSQTAFDKAMRGSILPEEIVEQAQTALGTIKEGRGAAYVEQLEKVRSDPRLLEDIKSNLYDKMEELSAPEKFDIGFKQTSPEQRIVTDPDTGLSVVEGKGETGGYKLDFSTSPIIQGRAVVKRAMADIVNWEDTSAAGLDALKKRLGTYVSQVKRGTPAEAFLSQLRSELADSLNAGVEGYKEMTAGYAETTRIIKDIESGLMLRPEGLTGRITGDMTLRRLSTAMKSQFELRKTLVDQLASRGSQDLAGSIAGNLLKTFMPRGIQGEIGLSGQAIALYLKPELWPVLMASSPRVAGEFLRLYGKALSEVRGVSPVVGKALVQFFSEENRKNIRFPARQGGEYGGENVGE